MSCDVAAAVYLFLAAAAPSAQPAVNPAPVSVAKEPLYADIVGRAGTLKAEAEAYRRAGGGPEATPLPRFADFSARVAALSDLDMKGHMDLAQRGMDGDLKCILKGISQDLPKRLEELRTARTRADQDIALREMITLLDDNIGVITAPPAPPI